MGVADEDLEREIGGGGAVFGSPIALGLGQCFAQRKRDQEQSTRKYFEAHGCVLLRKMAQESETVVQSTSTPTAERLPEPMTNSPS